MTPERDVGAALDQFGAVLRDIVPELAKYRMRLKMTGQFNDHESFELVIQLQERLLASPAPQCPCMYEEDI